jgi:MFS transporter, DHA2 family, multidrug resistance protein
MAIGLAAFEIVLEDGNRKDWFGDPSIVKLAWIAAIFIPAFAIIELLVKEPLVDLRLFARRNFRFCEHH